MGYNTRRASQERRLSEPAEIVDVDTQSVDMGDAPADFLHNLEAPNDEEDVEMTYEVDDSESEESDSDSDGSGDSRSEGELDDLDREMRELEATVNLTDTFHLVDRLGEGTFSSVYKAVDLHHGIYDNTQWRQEDNNSLTTTEGSDRRRAPKVYVALKRIYVTSSPARIQNELDILARLRGYRNVTYLISAFRYEDQVIAVIPYEKHQDFREYYKTADMDLIRSYFYCLLSGLAGAHEEGIIHRDIKPANFLFNYKTRHGTVCDFGLAQITYPLDWHGDCLHSLPLPKANLHHGKMLHRPIPCALQIKEAIKQYGEDAFENCATLLDAIDDDYYMEELETWRPAQKPMPGQRIGYQKPECDKRPSARANRAGTRGFRAPEVLFKCPDQTVSIDVWSVGITLLCFLTRRFPFFNSNDDVEALMEIACIFGRKRMEECGAMHNRVFLTNVPSVQAPFRKNLHELVRALNPAIFRQHRPKTEGPNTYNKDDFSWYDKSDLFQAVDLMKQCLALDCTRRITAKNALRHPFFAEAKDWIPPRP